MGEPLVSVVIPVFNGAPFVAKAVASIRAQTVKDAEIIVVDDGSSDGTQAILAGLQKTQDLTWLQQEHGGPARSRNQGIAVARGQFLALLDCDDVWLPEKLAMQLEIMRQRPEVGVVHTDFDSVDEQGSVLEVCQARRSSEPLVQAFCGGHVALMSTLLIRKSVLDKVGVFNPELYYGSEDSDLTIRLFDAAGFECVDRALVRKLQREHGYRDMAFDERTHRERVLASRRLFLDGLARRPSLRSDQRTALHREWASYYLSRGFWAERFGTSGDARRAYYQAIRHAPFQLRGYMRWVRTLTA